ncbi:hypothetical protein SteCoe_24781 [Stentor coeruleus]|uniref:ADP-ribosylglycohydrolase n=1 Tax=Stentor coeruleus TaxID=5963 RepID=A0A1R2BGS6_9CILI|nr:hypothetical protein SteCoe_24781 [Stentor coeruleus]
MLIMEKYVFDVADRARLNSALGCVFGAFIGDALGSALEFKNEISSEMLAEALEMKGGIFGNGHGQVTDDSELAMCIIHGLNDTLPKFSAESIAKYYKKWVLTDPFDIGITTARAFNLFTTKNSKFSQWATQSARNHNQNSLSNGSFMRCSPLAVYCRKLSIEDLIKVVTKDVTMTHPNEIIIQSQIFYVIFLSHLIENPQDRSGAWTKARQYLNSCNDEVKSWVKDIEESPPMLATNHIGYAKIAFDHTFRQILNQEINFENSMRQILLKGGDTDTNAAIVGAMIGAYVGYDELPELWKQKVENFDSMTMEGIPRNKKFLNQTLVKNLIIRIFTEAPQILEEIN